MRSLYKTNWSFLYSLSYFSSPLSPGTEIKRPPRLLKIMVLYGGIKMNTCDRVCCYDWVICLWIINAFFKYIYIYIYCKLGSVSQNQIRCKLLQLWGHKKTVNEHFKQCEITSELFTPYWCEIACSCGNTNSMPIYIVRVKLHVICFFTQHGCEIACSWGDTNSL